MRIGICATVWLLSATAAMAQERAILTTPETKPSNSEYQIHQIYIDISGGVLSLNLRGQNSEAKSCAYTPATNPTGTFLITALNKANLSTAYAGNATTRSLKQRIFHRLVIMGEAATVCTPAGMTGTLGGSVP